MHRVSVRESAVALGLDMKQIRGFRACQRDAVILSGPPLAGRRFRFSRTPADSSALPDERAHFRINGLSRIRGNL